MKAIIDIIMVPGAYAISFCELVLEGLRVTGIPEGVKVLGDFTEWLYKHTGVIGLLTSKLGRRIPLRFVGTLLNKYSTKIYEYMTTKYPDQMAAAARKVAFAKRANTYVKKGIKSALTGSYYKLNKGRPMKGWKEGIYHEPESQPGEEAAEGFNGGYLTSSNPQEGGFVQFLPAIMGALSAAPQLISLASQGINWIRNKLSGKKKADNEEERASGMGLNEKDHSDNIPYIARMASHSKELGKIEKTALRHKNINPVTYYKNLMHGTGYALTCAGFTKDQAHEFINHISKKKFGRGMAEKILNSEEKDYPRIKRLKYADLAAPVLLGRGIHCLTKNGMSENDAKVLSATVNGLVMSHGKREFNKPITNIMKGGGVFKTLQNKIHNVTIAYGGAIEKRLPAQVPYKLMRKSVVGKKRSNLLDTIGKTASVASALAPLGLMAYKHFTNQPYTAPPAYNPAYEPSAPPVGSGKKKKVFIDERAMYEL